MQFPIFPRKPTVAVIRLSGAITSGRGLSDASTAPLIERAFAKKPKAVALLINSPGGSPVQSSLIAARIRRLAEEKTDPRPCLCRGYGGLGRLLAGLRGG